MTGRGRPESIVGGFRRAGPVVRLLVLTQLAFNVGFFMVLPYLSVHLTDDLGQGAAVVGAVLGLRTLSQQGLFFVGGMIADRLGTRPVVLVGCACRVAGFLGLGLFDSLPGVVVGAALTGFAGALFSPAVEAALARASVDEADPDGEGERVTRLGAFALFTAFGQIGTFVGPLVGAVLLVVDFTAACVLAAALFVLIGCAHARWLPPDGPRTRTSPDDDAPGWRRVLGDRRFLLFAAVLSVQLVAYNQLYLLLPLAVDRAWGSQAPLGVLFALASVLVVVGQLPVAARTGALRPATAIGGGLGLMAAAFAVGAGGLAAQLHGGAAVAVLAVFVTIFTCGQMVVGPVVRAQVPAFAEERYLGTYYGVLASAGGLAVFPAATVTGLLVDAAPSSGAGAALPWAVMAAVLLTAAAVVGPVVSGGRGVRDGMVVNGR